MGLLWARNKRFTFQVALHVDEMSLVTSVTGYYYCKLRLVNNSKSPLQTTPFIAITTRQMVKNNCVSWRQKFEFTCKLDADPQSGVLKHCFVRLSVRKETKGGRTAAKVGFVDLDLAEFAESNHTTRHRLLDGYKQQIRLDNSILKIAVGMTLLSDCPCYEVPIPHDMTLRLTTEASDKLEGSLVDSSSSEYGSVRSYVFSSHRSRMPSSISQGSSGCGSLSSSCSDSDSSETPSIISQGSSGHGSLSSSSSDSDSPGTPIIISQGSSGYDSLDSSFCDSDSSGTPSIISEDSCTVDTIASYASSPDSDGPPENAYSSLDELPLELTLFIGYRREFTVENTRVDSEDIVSELMADHGFAFTCEDSSLSTLSTNIWVSSATKASYLQDSTCGLFFA